jgi:hypothetical protein
MRKICEKCDANAKCNAISFEQGCECGNIHALAVDCAVRYKLFTAGKTAQFVVI